MNTLIALLILSFSFLLYNIYTIYKKKRQYRIKTGIKKNYECLKIPCGNLNIVCRDYFEEKYIEGKIGFGEYKNIHKFLSVLKYKDYKYRGKNYELNSQPIEYSEDELREKLKKVKSIDIYINPSNPETHYFDLEFLLGPY